MYESFKKRQSKKSLPSFGRRRVSGRAGEYKVNGIDGYWGRYASVEKIIELACSLKYCEDKEREDSFTFYFPAVEYDGEYYHRIGLYPCEEQSLIEVEIHKSGDQCGSYFKKIGLNTLSEEIANLESSCKDPEQVGYVHIEN